MSIKLFYNPYSTSCFKAVAVAYELGLEVELVAVDMPAGAHKKPEFLAMNPNGKVPALSDDGHCVWESNAIISYLAAKKSEVGLLPSEPRALGQTLQWLFWQSGALGESTDALAWQTFYAKLQKRERDQALYDKAMKDTVRHLGTLDGALAGKDYVVGPLTVADFSLVSSLLLRKIYGIDLTPFSNLQAWVSRMESRDSVKKALPPL